MAEVPQPWGLVAEFEDPSALVSAIRRARAEGYTRLDAYSPFPIEEAAEALGYHRTEMPLVVLLGGVAGCVGGFLLQYWCMAVDYPLNVGGRPLNSWPSWIPVTFELTVLIAALAGVLGLLALCGLPTPYHPLFHVPAFARATRDRFFLGVMSRDPKYDPGRTRAFLETLGPTSVAEVPR